MFEREPKLRSQQHAEEDDDLARLRARERRPGKQSRLDAKPERPKHPGKRTREGEMHPGDAIAYAAAISDPAARTGSGYGTMGSAFGFVADPRYARIDRRAEPNRRDIDQAGLCGVFDLLEEIRGGERLPRELEERFAAELGLDPQRIRVHVGADAARVASELGARAVAIGDDIYFADGAYDPASPAGIELIAHEVAHVAQHQRGNEIAAPQLSRPEDAHEQEADRFATSFIPFAPPIDGARGEGTPGTGQQAAPNANAGAAGSVTHQTQQSAPGGGGDDRTKVGVGEKVDFTSDDDGAWTASNAHGPKTKSGKTYTWIAPVTADTVTITFTPKGGTAQPTTMTVIPPSDVQFDKTSDLTNFKSGTAGVGMVTNITFLPLDVSFAFVSWLEIPGGPSGQTGYFSKHTAPSHHPNPNPLHLGSNNAGPNDTASFFGVGKPWTDGFFEWVIPNHYVVDGESKPGHKFTDIHQTAKLDGDPNAGRMTVTKGTAGGATAVRSPDGTLAVNDPVAPSPDPSAADPSAAPDATAVGFGARGDGGDGGDGSDTAAAATITHTTDQPAANNPDGSRTSVGVGEKVAFEADTDGKWSATDAFGAKTATGKKYAWNAPVLANPSVTVTFTPKTGAAVDTPMTVVAPSDVELTKASDDTNIPSGTAGAGMITNVRFLPLDVSFRFTQWLEIGGAAGAPQNKSGFFADHGAPTHVPSPTPRRLGWDNAGPTDHAQFAVTKPAKDSWADGFFEWIIPNHYLVVGESGQGHQIVDIHQTATLKADGSFTTAKGTNGASSTQSSDGTVAAADPTPADPSSNPDPNAQAADPPTAVGEAIGIGDAGGGKAAGGGATTAAKKITHNTQKDAPGNADDTRTKVGVGEMVDFGSEFDGTWTASAAIGSKTQAGQTYTWQAPATATSATVTFKPTKGASQQVRFTVVAPNDLAFTKKSEEAFPAGSQGAGMILDVKIKPLDVSFAEAGILEIPGPGTGGTGYFKNRTIPHQPTADPTGIGDDNSVEDQADLTDWPAPYKAGFFEWVIPTNYVVTGEAKPGHHIKDIHQTFTMEGAPHAGRTTVTKGTSGAKVVRGIDGTVAMNDGAAAPDSALASNDAAPTTNPSGAPNSADPNSADPNGGSDPGVAT